MPNSTKTKQNQGKNQNATAVPPRARRKVAFKQASKKKPPRGKPKPPARSRKSAPAPTATRRKPRIGEKIGSFIGGLAQNAIGTIFGAGEYTQVLGNEIGVESSDIETNAIPQVNSLVKPVNSNIVSRMHGNEEGAVRIVKREFVGTINIATGVTNYEFTIGPNNQRVFPWLAGICQHWQKYQIMGLAAEYVPTSGAAVTSAPALGQVAMAFIYDTTTGASSFPTGNLSAMLNFDGAISMSPAAAGVCYLECDPELTNQPVKLVAPNPLVTIPLIYSSQNFYAAKLQILTSGASGLLPFQAGQLWITYEICLYNPRIDTIPPPILFTLLRDDKSGYESFLADYNKVHELTDHDGPYTNDEMYARGALIGTLEARLTSPEMSAKYARWRAIQQAVVDVTSDTSTDQPLLDYIHSTEIYKLMVKIDPPAKGAATPSDDWDSVSQASRYAPVEITRA